MKYKNVPQKMVEKSQRIPKMVEKSKKIPKNPIQSNQIQKNPTTIPQNGWKIPKYLQESQKMVEKSQKLLQELLEMVEISNKVLRHGLSQWKMATRQQSSCSPVNSAV